MTRPESLDFRQEIAEKNREAILDAAERLVERVEVLTFSAVSNESGLSRPTVYAHFEDRAALLEALVQRTVRRTMAAIASAELEQGPAVEALQRLLSTSWEHIAHYETLARTAAAELSTDAMQRAHHDARTVIKRLIERGRAEGAFRVDLSSDWLVTSSIALIHAAAGEVRSGSMSHGAALTVLVSTLNDLLVGGNTARVESSTRRKQLRH
jgi:AcrR family transcriptional regulator